ncbi:MAG: hypothetical protein LUD29_03595 [Clostridia bacterium]|nr:hypothetical protein [Clostridia bacterium]
MLCKYCGKEAGENYLYCPFCGRKLSDADTASRTENTPAESPAENAATTSKNESLDLSDALSCRWIDDGNEEIIADGETTETSETYLAARPGKTYEYGNEATESDESPSAAEEEHDGSEKPVIINNYYNTDTNSILDDLHCGRRTKIALGLSIGGLAAFCFGLIFFVAYLFFFIPGIIVSAAAFLISLVSLIQMRNRNTQRWKWMIIFNMVLSSVDIILLSSAMSACAEACSCLMNG